MRYQVQFSPYYRPFRRPLQTHHGNWKIREGVIVRLTGESGAVGWGEIAPIPWFGSETLEDALSFCRQLGDEVTTEQVFSIPDTLPASQFGFESALEMVLEPYPPRGGCRYSYLLPAGAAAISAWETGWKQGYRTFKWKIGVLPLEEEFSGFQALVEALPQGGRLRLDANGGLTQEEARAWLSLCDRVRGKVEFLEQPLPVGQFEAMLKLSHQYETAIALDESVATLQQLQAVYQKGWRGVFAIKPAIAGSPSRLRQFFQQHEIDAVFSSVFETAIGKQAALKLGLELSQRDRAFGFGVDSWFTEDEETWLQQLCNTF